MHLNRKDVFIIPNEYLYSLNSFGKPKTVTGNEAIYFLLSRLILLEKGLIQSHPDMGVGIISRYRYTFEDKVRDLQHDIEDQISTYLKELSGVKVEVSFSAPDRRFIIDIIIDGTLYKFNFNSDTAELDTVRTT